MHLAQIIGIGRTKTAEHWNRGLVELAVEAGAMAMDESDQEVTALVVGNSVGPTLGDQRNLAAYVGARLGLVNVETHTVEADEASGGSALRLGIALVRSGLHERVLVVGAEKATDALPDGLDAARANGLEVMREAGFGLGIASASAMAMQRYIHKHNVDRAQFYHLSALAHSHGSKNPMAFFAWPLAMGAYAKSPMVADPVTVCDTAPPCDGAAAVIISKPTNEKDSVKITGSSAVSTSPGIFEPILSLDLPAARSGAADALKQSGLNLDQISLFEIHDSSTVIAALSLEALGLAEPGKALDLAQSGKLAIDGDHPCLTFGGLKSRGNALGAAGVYQAVEATLQLRGQAEKNQVKDAQSALIQCLGSFGATAITHVLEL